jgi:hypothetical protein
MKKIVGIISIMIALFAVSIGASFWNNQGINSKESNEKKSLNEEESSSCEDNPNGFCSQLPLIIIETKGQQIIKDALIWSEIKIVDKENGNSPVDKSPSFETDATIKLRGSSSYATFDKRQYRIEFYENEESTKDNDYSLFGMGSDNEWILYGPFLDRTLIRNHLMYGLSRDIMEWAPDSRYCELFLNGEYHGVYLAVEPITNGENRLDLSKFGLLSGQTPYIIRRENYGSEKNVIHTYSELMGYTFQELSVEYPGSKKLTEKQFQWIEGNVSAFEESLYSDEFANEKTGYANYINVDSFVDYYILNEVAMISDAGRISTYSYKKLDDQLNMVVWDFNNGFNNYPWDNKSYDAFQVNGSNWFNRLLEDRGFVDKVIKRYDELRNGILSTEKINSHIDDDVIILGEAINRNYEVWGYTFNEKMLSSDSEGNVRDPKNYDEAIVLLKESINKRLGFLDENIDSLYDDCIN